MRTALFAALISLMSVAAYAAVEIPSATPGPDDLDVRIARLIEQLGDPQFATRERAQKELARLGSDAFEALTAAKDSNDVEVAAQAQYLVRQIRFEWVRPTDPAELSDLLKDYEGKGLIERAGKINQIAGLASRTSLALPCLEWLCRLARFEESQLLSKEAALKAMGQMLPADAEAADEHFATISRTVTRGRRPAALWLKTYCLERSDPAAAAAEWDKLIAAEEHVLDKQSETSPQIVSSLLRRQVGLLDKLNRPDDSLKAISRLVQLERGETQSLMKLVDWLRERKAWSILDDVTKRFSGAFASEPILLYALAQARLDAGDSKLANEIAAKAFALRPDQYEEHKILGKVLLGRGLKNWAERELRLVSDKMPLAHDSNFVARMWLSEFLHDEQREAEAAEVLRPIVEAVDRGQDEVKRVVEYRDRTPGSVKSRMLYFRACDARMKGEIQKETEILDQGIVADATDADVLIALYRLRDQPEGRRQRTKEMIENAVAKSRQDIEEDPENDSAYNQLAWLVANTEGDLNEAVQCSQKSVELRRASSYGDAASYLDTLAHCYYAQGDYENAVQTQQEAARLEPHTSAITRQLKVFKETLRKSDVP